MLGHLVLCAVVVLASSQTPEPCHSPMQWEGRETRIDRQTNYEERRVLFYDETNLRQREIGEIEVGSNRSFYDVLYLHKEGKEYRINLRDRQCNVSALARPFHYRGVIPGSKFQYIVEMGASGVPNEHTLVEIFAGNGTTEYHMSYVTYPDCIPVQNVHISNQTGYEHSYYYDITVGITDPMAFIPPPECTG